MSSFGVFDLCGNHIELTESVLLTEEGVKTLLRGTYWNADSIECGRAYRSVNPQACNGCFGATFRVAAPAP